MVQSGTSPTVKTTASYLHFFHSSESFSQPRIFLRGDVKRKETATVELSFLKLRWQANEFSAAQARETQRRKQHGMMGDLKRVLGPLCRLPALGQSTKTTRNTVFPTTPGTDLTLNATLTSLCWLWPQSVNWFVVCTVCRRMWLYVPLHAYFIV